MKRIAKLPMPGQRIVRSVVVIWLCFAVYELRGRQGIPFFSLIAALQCIKPYNRDMNEEASRRLIGTLIGAFWGLLAVLAEQRLSAEGVLWMQVEYLLLGLLTGMVIYFTVLLHATEHAGFAAVVFLSVTFGLGEDVNPYLHTLHRLIDTALGVLLAELVNRIQLPRRRNTEVLYTSSLMDTILGRNHQLSAYSKVELNRLLEDGAKFTLSTSQSQATVRELLQGVDLRYPIVTMDGAALYDMHTLRYLRTLPLPKEKGKRIMHWAREQGLSYFTTSIQEDLLVIRYAELGNEGMQRLFERKRSSPYRNFIHSSVEDYAHLVYVLILDLPERIEAAYAELMARPWAGDYRVVKDQSEIEGYCFLKIYDVDTSRETMLRYLEELMGTKETVTFGSIPGKYDVYVKDADRDLMVKELKRRFEPVDFRCWKTIFRK